MNDQKSIDGWTNLSGNPESQAGSAALQLLAKLIARKLMKQSSSEGKLYLKTDDSSVSKDDA